MTYGMFDLLHYGHIELLRRAKDIANGGKLIVSLSTASFSQTKSKKSHMPFTKRHQLLQALKYVDHIISEPSWKQKEKDIIKHKVDVFVMGDDWKGKFDNLKEFCEAVYLPHTEDVSSMLLKDELNSNK